MSSIEEDIKRCEQLTRPEHASWIGISNQLAILHVLEEYTRQKQINEEHKKINGELREKVKELENSKIIQDKSIRNGKPTIEGTRLTVIDVLLFMTEFIKEHEKEFRENYADINSKQIIDSINYLLESSIPKQKIKDKFEKIQLLYENNLKEVDLKEEEKIDIKIFECIRLEAQRDLARELLQEEDK